MKKIFLLMFFINGCTTPKQFKGPDGALHYETKCWDTIVDCYKKADKTCPNGYASRQEIPAQVEDPRERWRRAGESLDDKVTVNIGTAMRTQYTYLFDCK